MVEVLVTMEYATLALGLGAFIIACLLDIQSSRVMSTYGIPESIPLVRDREGNFSLPKALVFVIVPIAVVILLFAFADGIDGFKRVYAGLVLLPGAGLHLWAWHSNNRKIKAKKAASGMGSIV